MQGGDHFNECDLYKFAEDIEQVERWTKRLNVVCSGVEGFHCIYTNET